jgi:hypothetical protein
LSCTRSRETAEHWCYNPYLSSESRCTGSEPSHLGAELEQEGVLHPQVAERAPEEIPSSLIQPSIQPAS